MNTIELIKKVSDTNNITTGRAEMIISIIFERITEKLKKDAEVYIPDFGKFNIMSKKPNYGGQSRIFTNNYVEFQPDKRFLDNINS